MTNPNDRECDLLSIGAVHSFWDGLWLGIGPLLFWTLPCDRAEKMHLKIGDRRRKIHKRGKTGEQRWQKELLSRPFGVREVV